MQIAIIGCGNMGTALARRLSQTHTLFLYDRHAERAQHLAREGHGTACGEMREALTSADVVILAVKPQNMQEAASSMGSDLRDNQILVSLLAGTPIAAFRHHFPVASIVRMMPNLALIHGEGVIALSSDENTNTASKEPLTQAFALLGKVHWLPEGKMDALTALASSGPAFFFVMVEAMIEAGIAMGFTAKEAQGLVYQMLRGSLTLLENTHKHPGELKWQIASPQGTTIAGLKRLEELALRGAILGTFLAAYERAAQLSSHWKEEPGPPPG